MYTVLIESYIKDNLSPTLHQPFINMFYRSLNQRVDRRLNLCDTHWGQVALDKVREKVLRWKLTESAGSTQTSPREDQITLLVTMVDYHGTKQARDIVVPRLEWEEMVEEERAELIADRFLCECPLVDYSYQPYKT